jgi:TRAP-type mannitol/chloroaromatic compound transport system permease small subunit|tara:strand:- start:1441 stop:1989 length:549 start_codon:yes stop_codon:yes gene_type:complete
MGFFVGFTRFVDGLNDKIGSVIRWFTLAMVLVGAFNALARYAVRYTNVSLSSNGYLDLQWYLFSLIFLLGAAYGLNHDYHVRVDVFYSRMGKAGQAWIDLIGSLLLLIPFTILMLWVSWDPVRISWQIKEISPDPGGLPRYPIKSVILVSFVLLFLQGISQIIKKVQFLKIDRQNRCSKGAS